MLPGVCPGCGAASPTPSAWYMVSHMSAIKAGRSEKPGSTGAAIFFSTGWPYANIGNIISCNSYGFKRPRRVPACIV